MISRKILVMITFYLEDWIYKRITHLKSWHFQTVSLKGLVLPTWEGVIMRQEPFCTTCPKHNTISTTYYYDSTYSEDAYVWMDRFNIGILNCISLIKCSHAWCDWQDRQWLLKRWLALPLKDNKIRSREVVPTRKPGK
jgi:hypothetical protein